MEVIRTGNRSVVTMRITSPKLWVLSTHWDDHHRRTVLCARPAECPLCRIGRAKLRGYCIGRMKEDADGTTVGLIELCTEVVQQLQDHGLVYENAAGWTWRMQRREHRPGWKVLGASQQENPETSPPEALPLAIETLYGLPPATEPGDGQSGIITNQTMWSKTYADTLLRRLIAAGQVKPEGTYR